MILIGSVIPSFSQSYTIKHSTLDSLIMYAKKGKICDTLSKSFEIRIRAIEDENRLLIRQSVNHLSQIENFKKLDQNWSDRLQNANDLYQIDKRKAKTKLRKTRKIAIAEGGIICLLLAVLIL